MAEFIAGIPARHNADLERCRELISAAAHAGCHGVCFELFRIERLYDPVVLQWSANCRLRRRWELPLHHVPILKECARGQGLAFGLAPCDLAAVDAVQAQVDFLQIGPYELPWLDLVQHAASTGLPLALITAMADAAEAWNAVQIALEAGCTDLTMLHAVAQFPTPPEDCNLAAIGTLRELLVREFSTAYPDAELNAGWFDRSVSQGVVARAVNHWGCDTVAFEIDLPEDGEPTGARAWWLPDDISGVISGGYPPVRRECDGTGRIAPGAAEVKERGWRTDPGDGLRPTRALRQARPAPDTDRPCAGPTFLLVPDPVGLGALARCLALAERLRDDHAATVTFLLRDPGQQARMVTRHGFPFACFETLERVLDHAARLGAGARARAVPHACVLDLCIPAEAAARELQRAGVPVVVVGQPGCPAADLSMVPFYGWHDEGDRDQQVGGTDYLLVRDDVNALREKRPIGSAAGAGPRVVVCFGATDPHDLTSRIVSSLHTFLPRADLQIVLNPTADQHDVVARIIGSRFPGYRVISTADGVEVLLGAADVVITAMGQTAVDALCLGVPVVLLGDERSQAAAAACLAAEGAAVDLGFHDEVAATELTAALRELFGDPDRLSRLRRKASTLAAEVIDGQGASRAAARIMRLAHARS
jgi:N-acetylneuraminate synthase